LDENEFETVSTKRVAADDRNDHAFQIRILKRKT